MQQLVITVHSTRAQSDYQNHRIRRIDVSSGTVTTLAGGFNFPNGVAMDAAGSVAILVSKQAGVGRLAIGAVCLFTYYVAATWCLLILQADQNNYLVCRIDVATGAVSTLAGTASSAGSTNGVGAAARFFRPYGIAMDAAGVVAVVVSAWSSCSLPAHERLGEECVYSICLSYTG